MLNKLKAWCIALSAMLLPFLAQSQGHVPTLIFPTHGGVFLPHSVNFEWNVTLNAVAYHLQVSESATFSTFAYNNAAIATASQVVPGLPENKDLYWRVRAFNGVDSSAWSSVYYFYLIDPRGLGNMQLWVRADSGTVGGASVSQWMDYSGNNVQLIQIAEPTRRPTLTTAPQLNNAPVLRFDGNDYLDGGQALELRTNDQTILIVFNSQNANGAQYRLIQKRGHTSNTDGWCLAPRGFEWNSSLIEESNNYIIFQKGCCMNDGNYRIVSTVWDNSEATWQMNIESHITSSPEVSTSTNGVLTNADITQNANKIMTVGCSWNNYPNANLSFFLNGNIAEIMVYHTALDSISRARATQYLNSKYAPQLNLGRDIYNHTFCDTVINAAKPYFTKYFWYNLDAPTVLLADSLTGSTLTVTEPGIYRLQVVDIFGRSSSDTIRVDYPTAMLNAQLPGDTAICGGESIVIDTLLGSSYNYLWSTGDTTEALVITAGGQYFVEVAYPGFEACAITTDTFNVSVDLFSSIATLGPNGTFCTGNSLKLLAGAEDAVSYLWSDGTTAPELTLFTSGQYWVSVSDAIGCTVVDTIDVTVIPGVLPAVNFTADSVCEGASTSFTDSSTIASGSIASYLWEFGDNTTDVAANPAHLYAAAGYYNVTLTATSDIGCSNEATKTVVVFATPTVDYFTTLDSAGCIATSYAFLDSSFSTTPPDLVNKWDWNFGDGGIDSVQNPSHTYASTGTYDITLRVETQGGCAAFDTATVILLDGIPDPEPFSLYNPVHGATIGTGAITFQWNASLNVRYYIFQLATNPNFPQNSIITQVQTTATQHIMQSLAGGTYYWRVIAQNLCGTQVFANYFPLTIFSNGTISGMQLWLRADMGVVADANNNNKVSAWLDQSGNNVHMTQTIAAQQPIFVQNGFNGPNPVVTFNSAGSGTFMDGGNKLDLGTNDQSVFVVFNSTNNPSDQYRIIQKRGTPEQGASYASGWCIAARGGRLSPSFIQNETDFINFDVAEYQINNGCFRLLTTVWDNSDGRWKFFLEGTLEQDIQKTSTANQNYVTSKNLTLGCAWNSPSPTGGQTQFFSGSIAEVLVYAHALDNNQRKVVEEYLRQKYLPPVNLGQDKELSYGFCAGIELCALENDDHRDCGLRSTYQWNTGETTRCITAPGQGVYKVTMTDNFGFQSVDSVIVKGGFNSVSFADTVFVCLGDTLVWDTKLSEDGYTFQWQDGSIDSFYKIYEAGQYAVYIEDTIGCDFQSDTVTVLIDSFSVLATLGPDTNLCAKNSIALTVGAETAIQYLWSNGTTGSTLQVFTTDDYSVTAANVNRCLMFDDIHVNIVGIAPDADFAFNRTCVQDSTFFTDITPQQVTTWNWSFDDGSSDVIVQNPAHLFPATGFYDVQLTVKDTGICFQSITKTVEVLQLPVARFTNELTNCANDNVSFFDASTAPAAQTVTGYLWTFGDGNFTLNRNPVHNFSAAGFYPISLTVTTDSGCSNIAYDTLEIFPELKAAIGVGNLCLDFPVDFYDASPAFSNTSWFWTFGNGAFSQLENPIYTYAAAGTYVITLQVENALGCERSVKDTISVTAKPTVDFSNIPVCEDQIYFFEDNTITTGGDIVTTRQWNFGDQTSSMLENPTHVYDSAATYNVTLTVQTRNGCENFKTKPMQVLEPPTAAFTFTPDYGSAPLDVSFTNQSQGGSSYFWDFGDNTTSVEISPVHTYLQDEEVIIRLITANAAGCSDTAFGALNITLATLDLVLDEIILERAFNSDCSYYLRLGAYVLNVGTRNVTSFDITASNSLGGTIEEHWEGVFIDRQVSYPFSADLLVYDCSNKAVICMEVKSPNGEPDDNPGNNYRCVTLNPELVVLGPKPNPAGDFIHLDIITPARGDLRISNYNAVGQNLGEMHQAQVDKGFHQFKFDVSLLAQGAYLLRIEFNEESRVIKYTKQ